MRSQLEIQPESFNYFLFPRSDREALEMKQFEFLESEINRNNPDFIQWVQQSLNKILGLRLKDDGIIGAQTRSAIRTFQQQKGLVADGIVGPNTEASIKEMLRSIGIAPQTKPLGTTPSILTTPADQSIQRTIYGWGRYLKRVEELPADQQAILKGIGDVINVNYKPGGQPIRIVRVYGHADWDTPRNLQREKQMSDERARMVTDWLKKYVGRTIVSQITWDTQGFGATKLKAQPTTEVNRKQNRRVEINLLRGVGQIQSTPVFFTIEQPNAMNYVRMHDLFVYMATYQR